MKTLALISLLVLAHLNYLALCQSDSDNQVGQALFETNCTACHAVEKKVIGPALKDVHKKYEQDWLVQFIKSSQSMVKSGDADALAIFNEYNQLVMPDQPMSKEEIVQIINYIGFASEQVKASEGQNPIVRPAVTMLNFQPLYVSKYPLFWLFIAASIVALVVLVYLVVRIFAYIQKNKP